MRILIAFFCGDSFAFSAIKLHLKFIGHVLLAECVLISIGIAEELLGRL
jgi:hypothetical protein